VRRETEEAPKNRWGEPTGDDWMERGDRVMAKEGTTTGVVIGVSFGPTPSEREQPKTVAADYAALVAGRPIGVHDYVEILMDQPDGFTTGITPMRNWEVTRKVIRT
jgi:hypothetical protein